MLPLTDRERATRDALKNSQHLLRRWRAYLDAEDRLGDEGIVTDTIRENTDALAAYQVTDARPTRPTEVGTERMP